MDFELEDEYKKISGFNVGTIHEIGCIYYSEDYVKWLENKVKKLRVTDVSVSVCKHVNKHVIGGNQTKLRCLDCGKQLV